MNLRIPLTPRQGYNKVFDVGEYKMALTSFARYRRIHDALAGVYAEGEK